MQAVMNSYHRGGTPPPPGAEKWDVTTLGPSLSLSTDGLTVAKGSSSGSFSSVKSVSPFPAGQDRYFNAALVDGSFSPYQQLGIANAALSTGGSTAWPGSSENRGYSYDEELGDLLHGGSPVVSGFGSNWRSSANVCIAYKGSTNQIFVRLNGVWQHSGNPATGAGGVTVAVDTYFACFAMYGNPTSCTLDATTVDTDPLLAGFVPLAS